MSLNYLLDALRVDSEWSAATLRLKLNHLAPLEEACADDPVLLGKVVELRRRLEWAGQGLTRLDVGVGAEHLAGESAVGLPEAFGQIRRGSKGQGACEAGVGFLSVLGGHHQQDKHKEAGYLSSRVTLTFEHRGEDISQGLTLRSEPTSGPYQEQRSHGSSIPQEWLRLKGLRSNRL